MTPPRISDHLQAVADWLNAGDIPCGRGKPPDGYGPNDSWQGAPGQSAFTGYCFVSRSASIEQRSSTLDDTTNEAEPNVYIQCVGATEDQAEDLLDDVRARMDAFPGVPGRSLLRAWLSQPSSSFIDRVVTPHLYVAPAGWTIWTDPEAS